MSDRDRWGALTTVRFADRSDPMIDKLCCHVEELLQDLAAEVTINRLIEKQLRELGIELEIASESTTNPEE